MSVIANTTTTAQITLQAKEIDFITRFEKSWEALREILGIMRPVRKDPGTKLVASKASVILQDGNVAEGDEVPLSQAKVEPVAFEDLKLEKFRKAVTAETVAQFGAAVAVQKTDDAFLFELQSKVLDRFYAFAQTGMLRAEYDTFQMAVSMAVTLVKDKFKKMRRDFTNIIAFVNTVDVGKYLGGAQISMQNSNGIEYLKDFLGANTMIISSEIPQGTVIAVPADNIVLYYIDPGDGDFRELGLDYTTGYGETNLIGIHKEGNYGRVMGETHALMGMKLFAEYIDAISVITIDTEKSLDPLTVSSTAGGKTGETRITVQPTLEPGHYYKYKTDTLTAPDVKYGQDVSAWNSWDGKSDIKATSEHKITIVEADAEYKAIKSGNQTVTSKS